MPTRSTQGWDEELRVNTFNKISEHDHSGSGNGTQIPTAGIATDAITGAKIRLDNDEYLKGRNAANSGNINIIKVDTSDLLTFGTTLNSPVLKTPQIQDTSSDHQYVFAVNELAADRTITLPLLTGADEFVFKDHTVTLTNKTISVDSNTVSGIAASSFVLSDASGYIDGAAAQKAIPTGVVVGDTDSQTLTNKTIDSDNNTITNIVNADIKAGAAIAVNKLAAVTASRALQSDASGFIEASSVTNTELGYVSGVTSAIQTQINTKTDTGTANEITLTGTTIGLADNPVLPGTEGVTLPIGTTAQRPGSPTNGEIRYNSDTASFEGYKGGAWGELGGGSSGINYVSNPDAEVDTTGWAAYDDGSSANPVDGTGGSSVALTFSRNTSSPLRDTADFDLAKSAADAQGEGVSYDFTIDSADKYSILRVSFDYTTSTNYVDSDMGVYIYDVTNAALIRMSKENIDATSTRGHFVSEFQATDSTSYRLIIHVKTTSALAYDFNFDNVVVGPREITKGIVETAWMSYTPTLTGFGNPTNVSFEYKRVGSNLHVNGSFTTGTVTATTASITLPAGLTHEDHITVGTVPIGQWISANAGVSGGAINYSAVTATNLLHFGNEWGIGSSGTGMANGNSIAGNSQVVCLSFICPIVGWDASATISSDFGGRVIATRIYLNAATNHTSSGSYQLVPLDTTTHDSVGAATLASNRVTIPETGYYHIIGSATFSNISDTKQAAAQIYKNGAGLAVGTSVGSGTGTFSSSIAATTAYLVKGDYIQLYAYQNDSASEAYITGTDRTWLEVTKIQSPQTLIGSEVVAMTAYLTATDTGVTNKVIVFNNKEFDTHNALNTSTGVWTCPVSGIYNISASVYISNSGTPTNDNMEIRKNSVGKLRRYLANLTASTTLTAGSGSIVLSLVKGDTIDVYISGDASFDIQAGNDTTFSIMKV